MARFILMAWSNPSPDRDAEYATWYDETHLPDMLKVPGVVTAQRLRLLRLAPAKTFPQRYLCLYELEAENEQSARNIINVLNAQNLPLSEVLDVSSVALGVYEVASPRLEKPV